MKNVFCECGKAFKNENSMDQHKQHSRRHQPRAEVDVGASELGTSRDTRDGVTTSQAPNNKPLTMSAKRYSSRYRTVRFPWARESAPRPKAKKDEPTESARKDWLAPVWKNYGHMKSNSSNGCKERRKPCVDYKIEYIDYRTEENLNWGLCDKDCGWCGRCMKGKFF